MPGLMPTVESLSRNALLFVNGPHIHIWTRWMITCLKVSREPSWSKASRTWLIRHISKETNIQKCIQNKPSSRKPETRFHHWKTTYKDCCLVGTRRIASHKVQISIDSLSSKSVSALELVVYIELYV
ncbi:uncharacterized protein Gasu_05000 [Galdieria sulphuraria]|uniref:Uncharacterized protein n=1 Tax=Galdieria sulphuraria TaxID=130081 RepID=M2Y988_GALSU|nr:uncharacterized protein Gasu_05000 [Galdieria sulphuraria]EME32414.1 hypothetical protein Gasu_05000 [Galdieria sulphuraria]|eukprot:XP_005708934.1 hypothetical protein Gasu_05000 [Galdieria sulphuraria]